jgi:CoA-transferase family III
VSPIAPALAALSAQVAALTGEVGRRVNVASLGVTDRQGQLALNRPGQTSPNGACRMIRAADGWIALNLARDEDRELLPAWLRGDFGGDPWGVIAGLARRRTGADLIADAVLLGLPAGRVGEVVADSLEAPVRTMAAGATWRGSRLRVVDLSALWAGPMCGGILAEMGASVVKVESVRRPDPTRTSTPEFFRRLNGLKAELQVDLTSAEGQTRLRNEVLAADVFVTSARPRAFAPLGIDPEAIFAANPGLTWVAITGYGCSGEAGARVAFGDDAAAAGGLVRWTPAGAPRFLGDALSDPVTGLAAAVGTLKGVIGGGGVMVDVALAGSAAGAAALCGYRRAT